MSSSFLDFKLPPVSYREKLFELGTGLLDNVLGRLRDKGGYLKHTMHSWRNTPAKRSIGILEV